jgi:hypothetical protein
MMMMMMIDDDCDEWMMLEESSRGDTYNRDPVSREVSDSTYSCLSHPPQSTRFAHLGTIVHLEVRLERSKTKRLECLGQTSGGLRLYSRAWKAILGRPRN